MKDTRSRLVAAMMGVAMAIGIGGVAAAETVEVDVTPAMVQAYEDAGVQMATLTKDAEDLTKSERRALQAIYEDGDTRGWINGVVLEELWDFIDDDETIATVKLAGRVYEVGMPEAFDE